VSWFSLLIGQNASRQLATSSENLVASAEFLVALATSESQFRALLEKFILKPQNGESEHCILKHQYFLSPKDRWFGLL